MMKKETNNVEINKSIQLEMDNLPDVKSGEVFSSDKHIDTEKKILEESEQSISKQKSKKSKILNVVFFIINIIVVALILFFQIKNEDITSLSELFASIKPGFLLLTCIVFVVILLINSLIIFGYIKSYSGRKRYNLAIQTQVIGRYYDNITPLGSGGQPFQIFYLNKRGLTASTSLAVTMSKYIICQLAWMVFSLIALTIAAYRGILFNGSIVSIVCIIGFLINLALVSAIFVLSISKKIGKKLVVKTLKFLEKIRIIKNYEKQYLRVMNVINDYQTAMRQVTSNFKQFLLHLFLGILQYVLNYSLPFLIYCSFFGFNGDIYLEMLLFSLIIDLAACIIPLPGGTGMSELSFTAVFASLFGGNVFWGLLVWRFFGYYLYLALGIIFIAYNYFVGDKKYKWLQRKWELEAESNKFKEEQYKNYRKKASNMKSRNIRLN